MVKDWGGKTSIALVYPNIYEVGMGNLAVHALYRMLNDHPNIVCERAFSPARAEIGEYRRSDTPLLSIETQRAVSEFDIVAFTISFENDYLNILPILDMAHIGHLRDRRPEAAPLLIAGGAAPTLNPLPIDGIFDAVCLGEAEAFMDDLIPTLLGRTPKHETIAKLEKLSGMSPSSHERRHTGDLDGWKTQTVIHSDSAEFGDMHLIEVQRGCPHRCEFCATPVIYAPPRMRSFDSVMAMVGEGLARRRRFGLIGADILSHPDFAKIARAIHERGATFSPSSVRADAVDDEKARLIAASGHRSVALGIEAGSERLRFSIGKGTCDDRILEATKLLARAGIANARLYFMIGLPDEDREDIEAIASISKHVRNVLRSYAPRTSRQCGVSLTIAPFVPKPATPMGNAEFTGEAGLKQKIKQLKRLLDKEDGISAQFESPLAAAIEALLANGGPETLAFLEEAHRLGNPRRALARLRQ